MRSRMAISLRSSATFGLLAFRLYSFTRGVLTTSAGFGVMLSSGRSGGATRDESRAHPSDGSKQRSEPCKPAVAGSNPPAAQRVGHAGHEDRPPIHNL